MSIVHNNLYAPRNPITILVSVKKQTLQILVNTDILREKWSVDLENIFSCSWGRQRGMVGVGGLAGGREQGRRPSWGDVRGE